MSLFGSLFTGVSALGAQSRSMGMISDNISNVNTTGYKQTNAAFQTLVTGSGGGDSYSPGSVRASAIGTVDQQGILQQTQSTTDLAVEGNGFFQVQGAPGGGEETLYTRVGSFSEDRDGNLQNANGFFLVGQNIATGNEEVVNLANTGAGAPVATQNAEITFNLDSRTADGGVFERNITVYDSLGQEQQIAVEFTKTANDNEWDYEVTAANSAGPTIDAGTITFNADGSIPAGDTQIDLNGIDWLANGSAAQDITLDLTGSTQYAATSDVTNVNQDGAEQGQRTGVNIDENGVVSLRFSNGQNTPVYQLSLANFSNPNGLETRSGNVFAQTRDSGAATVNAPGSGGAGTIAGSTLEGSNVDLADEFSKMIVTQRAYSAGSKIISTSDQMLEELLRIR